MNTSSLAALGAACVLLAGCATSTRPGAVNITRQQFLLVPAATVERLSLVSYAAQADQARSAGKLITAGPQYARILAISKRLRDQVSVFRDDTGQWKWALVLIDAPTINATCAPGGKITFYTGIIDRLRLTDDEIAAVMGHEIAHALREHGRERMSQAVAQNAMSQAVLAGTQNKSMQVALANQAAHYLFVLPNSRQNESEADKIGLELAARAGYDPQAAISLWRKMAANDGGKAPPEFLSTHPASATRLNELASLMPTVRPLYERAGRP